MTLPIPKCALCGEALIYKPRIMIIYNLPGRPQMAWCWDCYDSDPITIELRELLERRELPAIFADVADRGVGRVVAGPAAKRWRVSL